MSYIDMSRKARAYIKLPREIRKITDPIVKNRGIYVERLDVRAKKGKQILKKLIIGKKRKGK